MLLENIKVIRVSDPRSGTSAETGKPWCARNILLGFEDEGGESYLSAAVTDALWQELGYRQGDIASLHLRFRTRKFKNGFLFNDIRIVNPNTPYEP